MNIEEIKSRLMKMKALANAGVGGERANAEKLLVELAEKYSINLDEFEDGEEVVEYKFNFSSTWQRKLFGQLAALMRQEKKEARRSAARKRTQDLFVGVWARQGERAHYLRRKERLA